MRGRLVPMMALTTVLSSYALSTALMNDSHQRISIATPFRAQERESGRDHFELHSEFLKKYESIAFASPDDLRQHLSSGLPVIDVRQRTEFVKAHFKGSISSPADEANSALDTLPSSGPVLLVCDYKPGCDESTQQYGGITRCSTAAARLKQSGHGSVRVIPFSINQIKALNAVSEAKLPIRSKSSSTL